MHYRQIGFLSILCIISAIAGACSLEKRCDVSEYYDNKGNCVHNDGEHCGDWGLVNCYTQCDGKSFESKKQQIECLGVIEWDCNSKNECKSTTKHKDGYSVEDCADGYYYEPYNGILKWNGAQYVDEDGKPIDVCMKQTTEHCGSDDNWKNCYTQCESEGYFDDLSPEDRKIKEMLCFGVKT